MIRKERRSALLGVGICAAMMFAGGAKLATLLPLTPAGEVAWAAAFGTGAAQAAGVTEVSPGEIAAQPQPAEPTLAAIARERELIAAQHTRLDEAAARIALARAALAEETARLEALKATLDSLLERAEARHAADVAQLVSLYGGMKPKDAAAQLTQMDLEVVVYVMTEMDARRGAPILAAMPPEIAQAISQVMLERAKMPGDQKAVQVRLR